MFLNWLGLALDKEFGADDLGMEYGIVTQFIGALSGRGLVLLEKLTVRAVPFTSDLSVC